jgi:tRNA/tmRNA/rRNA uracil-C5-methylase (TrmA/RlmC/RlmD family)
MAMAQLKPRSIVYVACDPAALARDTTYLSEVGFEATKIRAFDLFPMTHHIETVALFTRVKVS